MVCLHHHPIAMDSRWLDTIGLANAEEFWRIIDSHAHVRAVAWGHVHQAYEGTRGGVRLFATPSTCAQFLPKSDRYAIDRRPPAYRSFQLHPDGEHRERSSLGGSAPAASSGRLSLARHTLSLVRRTPSRWRLSAPALCWAALLCSALCVCARADTPLHSLVGAARQAQHRLSARLDPCAAAERLPARARGPRCLPKRQIAHDGNQPGRDQFRSTASGNARERDVAATARPCRQSWDRPATLMREPRTRGRTRIIDLRSVRALVRRRGHFPNATRTAGVRRRNPASKCISSDRARTDGKAVAGLETAA